MGLTKGRLRSGMKPILQVTQRRFAGGHAKEVALGGAGTRGHAEEVLLRPGFAEAEDGLKRQRRVCRGHAQADRSPQICEYPKMIEHALVLLK